MPLTNYAFADLITFTRSTTATFVGSNGLIQSAAINAPRFDFNPVTLAPLGFLIEEQRVNLALYSDQFDNAAWSKALTTITANATTSPDGTTNADKLTPTAVSGEHYARQTIAISTGASITVSIYVKADGYRSIRMRCLDAAIPANGFQGSVDTSTGTTLGSVAGAGTFTSASAVSVGNGWWRLTVTGSAGATAASIIFDVFVLPGDQNSASSFTGDGTSGLFLWGAQFEVGAFATSYIPTVVSTVTRARDVATITGADFSPWYNANEGTFVVSFSSRPTAVALVANDGSFNNRLPQMGIGATSLYENFIVAGGSVVATLNPSGTHVFGTPATLAVAYAVNNYAASANGGTVVTDTSGVLPTGINNLNMGSFQTGASTINGYLRNITYYPTRLTDAQLQALTA